MCQFSLVKKVEARWTEKYNDHTNIRQISVQLRNRGKRIQEIVQRPSARLADAYQKLYAAALVAYGGP